MTAPGTTPPDPTTSGRSERSTRRHASLRDFWKQVTEGLELEQLWGQLKAETKASYGLYSREVDWVAVKQHKRARRLLAAIWALFLSMLMKLSPARRVLLLVAVVLLIVQPEIRWGGGVASLRFGGFGALLLFLLLALELADRVTMKRDLEIAREIQSWLVPAKPPQVPGADIAFATRPQNTVAGDYYDAFLRPGSNETGPHAALSDTSPLPRTEPEPGSSNLGTQRLLLAVADVAGKSVPAALLMATFQASLQTLAALPDPLEKLVASLNRYACAHSLGGLRFTTAFLAECDPVTHALRYVNAGHNAPALRRASGSIERLEAGGLPLGIFVDAAYASGSSTLGAGDVLVIFTDGLVEAVNEAGDEYGEPRLLERINALAGESAVDTLKHVMADVDSFVGDARQHDDITCLVFRAVASDESQVGA